MFLLATLNGCDKLESGMVVTALLHLSALNATNTMLWLASTMLVLLCY